jgi:hemoglobin/transferrin/lactoferrin receptor protein
MRNLGQASRRGTARRALGAALMLTTSIAATAATAPSARAQAAAQAVSFRVPAGPLGQALVVFGRQSGLQVTYLAASAAGKTSPGMTGRATPDAALARILSGSGLVFSFPNATTVSIGQAGSAGPAIPGDGATLLNTIDVTAGSQGYGGLGGLASPDAKYEVAQSVEFVSEQQIERFRGSSVGDFLKGMPGVLTGDNRNSGAIDVNIRGMQGFGRVPVVVDGTQQQNTVYRGYSGVASRNYVDPDFIGGVVVEKGPSAGVYGVGATGGVVRMETINADDIIVGGKAWGVRLKGGLMTNTASPPPVGTPGGYPTTGLGRYITGCNWNCTIATVPTTTLKGSPYGMDRPATFLPTSGAGSASFAARNDMAEIVLGYSRRKNGNYFAGTNGRTPEIKISHDQIIRPGIGTRPEQITDYTVLSLDGLNRYRGGEEVLNTSQDNTSYLAKAKLELDGGHIFDASFMRYESNFGEMMPSVIIRFDGATQAQLSDVAVNTYRAGYKHDPESHWIDFKANVWMTDTETHIRTPYAFNFGNGNILEVPQGYWDVAKRYGTDAVNTSTFETALGKVEVAAGGSYIYETIAPPSGVVNIDSNERLASRDGWRQEASGFVAGTWNPTQWLKFDSSLRYTWTESYDNGSNYGSTLHNHEVNDGFAPIIAATIEPIQGIEFYARYAEAIRAPSLFESTTGFSFNVDPLTSVLPEHARNTEIGFNVLRDDVLTEGDKLRLKISHFNNDIDDYLTRTNYPAVTVRNIPNATFVGWEGNVGYDVGWGFAELSGTYYTDIHFCAYETGGSLACRPAGVQNGYAQLHVPPKKSGTITAGLRFLDGDLEVGGRLTYMGDRGTTTTNADTGGYTTVINWDQYTLVDLFASYKVNDHVMIDAAVDNLTDVYYMDALTLGLMPSPGRTIRASLTAKF